MAAAHDILLDLYNAAASMRALLDESPNDNPEWMQSECRNEAVAALLAAGEFIQGWACDETAGLGGEN